MCNIINVFTGTSNQFNASLLKKSINFLIFFILFLQTPNFYISL